MPNPTLYDNFSQVKQYIDQNQVDLSSYVSKSELSGMSYATTSELAAYLPLSGGVLDGKLVSTYYTTIAGEGGIDTYSSVLVGADDRNSVTMLATRRLCGGTTSYAAAFFTNSDGRSKFTHKTKTGTSSIGGNDDAFMCFNAYGFKLAYSGEQGVSASVEYDVLHTGNIGNLGYVSGRTDIPVTYIGYSFFRNDTNDGVTDLRTHQITARYIDIVDDLNNPTEYYASISDEGISTNYGLTSSNYTLLENWIDLDGTTYTHDIIPSSNNSYTLGDANHLYKNIYGKNINIDSTIKFWQASNSELDIDLGGATKYFFNSERFAPSTANNHNKLDLGKSDRSWRTTYTNSLYLRGQDLETTLITTYSIGKIHVGIATHNRTTYTTTCTVDDFETDSNGKPLAGTMIAVKLTSITGTNPATLYQVHFVVNDEESDRLYGNTNSANNGFGNGRNWYRDMNDGLNRYWYWVFDGTYWVWHGISDERDTTYSAMSDAEASAGTSTSARLIKPVTLATYYTAKSCFSFNSSTNTLTITTT